MTTRSFYTPEGKPTWRMVFDLLCLVGANPNPDHVKQWTEIEKLVAYDWAIREHLHASDNAVRRRAKPWFVDALSE